MSLLKRRSIKVKTLTLRNGKIKTSSNLINLNKKGNQTFAATDGNKTSAITERSTSSDKGKNEALVFKNFR